MVNLTGINPYVLYIKIAAVVVVLIAIVSGAMWFKGVLDERNALKLSEATAVAQATMYKQAYEDNKKLQGEISNAVKNIRVVSNNYIQSVETDEAPDGPDGSVLTLVAGGMPKALSSVPTFSNASTGGKSTNSKTR